jgi:ABC-type transport system involved in multi-copper enzyme maturation permease subunit
MKATTHTELYRPFRGTLRRLPVAPFVLARSGIRTAFRNKKALALYLVPALHMVATSFIVNTAFGLQESGLGLPLGDRAAFVGALASTFTKVEQQIVGLLAVTQFFTLMVLGWYGSGLIAEDRRAKAHLLYFARPLTRSGYIFGKLLVVMFYGSCAIVLPATLILLVACFSSPEWSFLTERWRTILAVEAYALVWVFINSLGVLAISSLAQRKNHALVASVGVVVLTSAVAEFLAEALRESAWRKLSLFGNFEALARAWLDSGTVDAPWPVEQTYAILAGLALLCGLILFRQVTRMERAA